MKINHKSPTTYVIILIFIVLSSCVNKLITQPKDIIEDRILTDILDIQNDTPIFLVLKNDSCHLCQNYTKYLKENNELITKSFNNNINIHFLTVNSLTDENVWLFHILQRYAFPMTVYLDRKQNRMDTFEGADLYRLSSFLDSMDDSQTIQKQKNLFEVNWPKIGAYHKILGNHEVTKEQFNKIASANAKRPTFIGILIEGLYYKQQNIHPERIKIIKEYLTKAIDNSNGFFEFQKKYTTAL